MKFDDPTAMSSNNSAYDCSISADNEESVISNLGNKNTATCQAEPIDVLEDDSQTLSKLCDYGVESPFSLLQTTDLVPVTDIDQVDLGVESEVTEVPGIKPTEISNENLEENSSNNNVLERCTSLDPLTQNKSSKKKSKRHSHTRVEKSNCTNEEQIPSEPIQENSNNVGLERENSTDMLTHRTKSKKSRLCSRRRFLRLLSNSGHVIVSLALIQVGIITSWYSSSIGITGNNTVFVVYSCIVFMIAAVYGYVIILKKLSRKRRHRIVYLVLSSLCIVCAVFIMAAMMRLLLLVNEDKASKNVLKILYGVVIALCIIELPTAGIGIFYTLYKRKRTKRNKSKKRDDPNGNLVLERISLSKVQKSLLSVIDVSQITFGVCICELTMVGMLFHGRLNITSGGLLSASFISVSFVATGAFGLYNQLTNRTHKNFVWYCSLCLLSAICATVDLVIVVLSVNRPLSYSGSDIINTFQYMILCLSGAELLVSIASIFIIGFKYFRKYLGNNSKQVTLQSVSVSDNQ